MSTPAVNVLIWLSIKPIIKLVLPAAAGFFLTKAGLFPVAASRGAAQIVLNVTLPALLFSKIIPSFTPDNIAAIGPIVLVSVFYIGLSLIFAVLVRAIFPTPRNFRYGIIAAGGWSNWGDLPTSVVSTVTLSSPFNGVADSNLAIAYVAIFVFYISLFPLKGVSLIERDYTHPPPILDDEAVAVGRSWRKVARDARGLVQRPRRRTPTPAADQVGAKEEESEKESPDDAQLSFPTLGTVRSSHQLDLRRVATARSIISVQELAGAAAAASFEETSQRNRRASLRSQQKLEASERIRLQSIAGSRTNSVFDDEITNVDGGTAIGSSVTSENKEPVTTTVVPERSTDPPVSNRITVRRIACGIWTFARSLLTPPTISLVCALVIALVSDLKALFIVVSGSSFHPTAPDGDPPLSIILDSATFMGNASVPLGLFILGAALARMSIPRPFSKLPLASIASLAIAKLVLLPIIGYFFVKALVAHTNLVSADNKVLIFVLVYFSCVPTATTQVALTQIYAPIDGESNSDTLAAYLIVQYAIFAISSVFLTSFTLSSLF